MKEVYSAIDELIFYAEKNLGLAKRNKDYVKNSIFNLLGLDSYDDAVTKTEDFSETAKLKSPEKLVEKFKNACLAAGLFEECEAEKYCDAVMGELSLTPKEVEDKFYEIEKTEGAKAATEWFYDYSVKNDYVKKAKLDLNPRFEEAGLIVTINKAKPEFRDAKTAASGNKPKGGYPKCNICHENEGFSGRSKRTLRTVNVTLGGEEWFWQFSPYGYFYQHGIVVNYKHTPMHVDKGTFGRLMDFADRFPHYFIGSNAALPRIGGSVLAHDHYQGGGEILPLQRAAAYKSFAVKGFGGAKIEILEWPGTAVRVVSEDKNAITEISSAINECWLNYDKPELGLISHGEDGERRHAVSPTVIKTARGYEMNIILRSNIATEEFPDGVFHAHPEFHVIKKESIGLIEAQGLFILPGRLDGELKELGEIISRGEALPEKFAEFKMIAEEIKAIAGKDLSEENVSAAIRKELGSVCYRILQNTAVFKDRKHTEEFLKVAGVI